MRENPHHAFAALLITRILILSYFVALALGLIRGADMTRLLTPFLPMDWAVNVMRFYVLTLTGMVLFGVFRRPAALVLAISLFWASYMTMFAAGDITGFWRDLALIGGLLVSAGVGQGLSISGRESTVQADDTVVSADPEPDPGDNTVKVPLRRVTITRMREDLNYAREG